MGIKQISSGKNFKAIDIGKLDELDQHEFVHPKLGTKDGSRLFVGEALGTKGSEISFRELAPGTTVPFLHKHYKHEEVYIFLKGCGQFQVDALVFDIKEGSIVKVDSGGSRSVRNNSDSPMIYMVLQATEGTLAEYNVLDGYRVEGEIKF